MSRRTKIKSSEYIVIHWFITIFRKLIFSAIYLKNSSQKDVLLMVRKILSPIMIL